MHGVPFNDMSNAQVNFANFCLSFFVLFHLDKCLTTSWLEKLHVGHPSLVSLKNLETVFLMCFGENSSLRRSKL